MPIFSLTDGLSPESNEQLDNFKRHGWKRFESKYLLSQDTGQKACVAAFVEVGRGGDNTPMPCGKIMEVARVSIEVAQALR